MNRCLLIPGWATRKNIFEHIKPDNCECIDLNFDKNLPFPETVHGNFETIICYSLGTLLGLKLAAESEVKKIIIIGGFSNFLGTNDLARARKLKLNLMLKGLTKDPTTTLKNFYLESEIEENPGEMINIENLKRGLEILRDWDLSESLKKIDCQIYTIHGSQDRIVPENLNREQFPKSNHYALNGNHGIIQSHSSTIKNIISEITKCR